MENFESNTIIGNIDGLMRRLKIDFGSDELSAWAVSCNADGKELVIQYPVLPSDDLLRRDVAHFQLSEVWQQLGMDDMVFRCPCIFLDTVFISAVYCSTKLANVISRSAVALLRCSRSKPVLPALF